MQDTNLFLSVACALTPGIGPQKYQALRAAFATFAELGEASEQLITSIIGSTLASSLYRMTHERDVIERFITSTSDKNIGIIAFGSPQYPEKLLTLSDPPICLFVAGVTPDHPLPDLNHIPHESQKLAIVGSRKHTLYGKVATEMIAAHLARAKVTVVSGLALGIDTIAHETTLLAKGNTIAVLGCGVDVIYPSENTRLYHTLLENHHHIISEFIPGTKPSRGTFVARNRIISGISSGTILIEGDMHSGSLTTAGFAAEQNRDVFAVPGPITSALSAAPLRLLREGAILITEPQDILDHYALHMHMNTQHIEEELSDSEKNIVRQISQEALFPDEIALMMNMTVSAIMCTMTELELKNIVRRDDVGRYQYFRT